MVQFTLAEVLQAVGGELLQDGKQQEFSGVVTDTRRITAGCIFVALRGERFDGNDFAGQAAERGASCLIVSRALAASGAAVIKVKDTLTAYQQLAKLHRRRFHIPLIAITGSNGKTTTKDLTASVLAEKYHTLKTEANFNNEIGLPLTLLKLEPEHEAAVVEMGMRGLGQIRQMAAFAEPTIAVVTNVGETHMELLGSIENIAKAKSELVEAAADGLVFLNADNPHVLAMRELVKGGRVVLFGCSEEADVRAFNITGGADFTEFDCTVGGAAVHFRLPMAGRHNVYNALAAIAVGYELGLAGEQLQRGLLRPDMTAMRMSVSHKNDWTIINDAYNASPMSMQAALQALKDIAPQRRLAVLGDMLELGEASLKAHRSVGCWAAEANVAVLIVIGEQAAHIAAAAREGGVAEVIEAADHQAAAAELRKRLQKGDTILFKGSRGMQMEKVIELI